jgi:hypothetical protein
MEFCERTELDAELAALLTKLYMAIDTLHFGYETYGQEGPPAPLLNPPANMPFSDLDNDEFKQLFETPDYGFTQSEFDAAVLWFNQNNDFYHKYQFPAAPNPLDYPLYDYDDLSDLD